MKKKNILTEKYVETKSGKRKLLDALISSVSLSIFIYAIVGPLNKDIINILELVGKDVSALEFTLILFPIVIIVNVMYTLGYMVIKIDNNKEKK